MSRGVFFFFEQKNPRRKRERKRWTVDDGGGVVEKCPDEAAAIRVERDVLKVGTRFSGRGCVEL